MTGIVVITHNGRMPSEGGKRMGYMCDGRIFPLPGISITVVRPTTPSRPKYADLPRCRSAANRCPNCGSGSTNYFMISFAEGGRSALRCEECDTLMRSYYD
jgi:hypothetical protein